MNMQKLERLPTLAAVILVILVVAACTIHLRGDEEQTNTSMPANVVPDPLATKLRECRSVTLEQKGALSECRKAWAEKRSQFLGQKAPTPAGSGTRPAGSSLFAAPKDESRMPPGYPQIQQSGKE
jgi:conjugative transfer region protein TrbK